MSNTSSLYPLETLPFTSREFHTKFTNLVGPLSLFDPEDNADTGNENPEVKRPLTPIEDAIKGLPSSFSTFAKLVHPRLCPREGITGLSVNDQQQLIGVLMSELNSVWQDVQRGPPDPFLTPQQNRELQRRLTIEIVVIAQGLFAKYLDKAQKLNQRGVFSGPANLSRLKTQLALDASKSLNVLSLRRNLSADMKHPSDASTISSRFSINRTLQAPQNIYKPLVVRQENERKAQSNLTREEKEQLWVDKEINDLQRRMPRVEPIPFMAAIAQNVLRPRKQVSDPHSVIEDRDMEQGPTTARIRFLQKEKFPSVPELFSRETVQEELGIPIIVDEQERAMRRTKSASHVMDERKLRQPYHSAETTSKKLNIADRTSEDLIRLTSRSLKPMGTLQEENDGDDLPPLLQALARYSTTKKDKTTRKMNESGGTKDEDDDAASTTSTVQSTEASSAAVNPSVLDENITEFTGEDHPQPATVSLRLPNKSVVRASDVRVSNRVNKASVTVTKFPTVYNDLSGEIDAPTVKWLDRNLFIGEEIKEVYEEIIKTIGADHLLFDQDEYVEKSTSAVDVTISTASSSLEKPRSERIINKNLKKAGPPPWGKDTADNWRNSPKFGGLGREDILQAKLKKNEEENQTQKSYNSWLAWWRSTITKDDFLKYLSTQENDYMSLMFHLYDSDHESDVEEDDDDARPDTLHMALLRERERKLTELKTLKNDYHPGLWNVNSVLLGGLGNDPEVNDDELRVNVETTRPTATQSATTVSAQSLLLSSGQRSVASGSEISADTATLKIAGNDAPHTSSIAPARTLSSASEDASLSVQDRLERVWTLLCMPDGQRLDMAIKYSSEPYSNRLMESITLWEAATEVVLERERLMTKLEDFERTASDPNRFFIKGFPGSSASRIRESKTRDWFNKRLSQIDSDARKSVTEVSRQFGDTVTFQGRPYLEKMSVDRTEMFYWLQQERRQQVFEKEFVKVKELTLKPTDLPPIEAHTLL